MPKAGSIVGRLGRLGPPGRLGRAGRLLLTASMLGAGLLAAASPASASPSGCASPAGKCFAVSVSPAAPAAGGTVTFTFTITNQARTQRLGSAQITAPAANFVITGATVPSGAGTASFTAGSALFANLSLAPCKSVTVTVTVVLPCSGGSYQWGVQAKQANDFNGPPGNDFKLDPASAPHLSGSLAGTCSLAFTSDGEPAGTTVGANVAAGFDSQGGPVKVALLDAAGQLITSSAATGPVSVTVSIESNPGGGSLSGTITEPVSAGIASFPALSVTQPGVGYTLIAATTSPAIAMSAPSSPFTIFGSLKSCASSWCSASLSSKTTTGTVTTSSASSSAPLLGSTLGGASYNCPSYQSVSDPLGFDVFSTSGTAEQNAQFTASLGISQALVKSSGRTSPWAWQICYASKASFTALPGTLQQNVTIGGTSGYFTGLLPNCSSTQGAPCVKERKKIHCGDIVITFLAVGDPFGRG